MKRVRRFWAVAACCTGSALVAALPAFSDTDTSPYTQVDPDGVPLSLSQPGVMTPTLAAAAQRARESESAAPKNQDWLVRGYEQQLLSHPNQSADSNLYLQLSTSKQLSEISGLSPIDAGNPSPRYSSSIAAPQNQTRAGRSSSSYPSSLGMFQWHPLITPIGSSSLVGTQNSLMTLSPFFANQPTQKAAPRRTSPDIDASMLETPGLVAAAKDPMFGDTSPDLSLDLLPGESPAEAMQRQNAAHLELPTTADELHQQDAAQLSPPKPETVATGKTTTSEKKKTETAPAPVPDENAPTPVTQLQPVSPVRAPIASPYSILNR